MKCSLCDEPALPEIPPLPHSGLCDHHDRERFAREVVPLFACGERVEKLDSEGGKRSRKRRLRSEPSTGKTRKTASACSPTEGAPSADTSTSGRPELWECPRCRNTTSSR